MRFRYTFITLLMSYSLLTTVPAIIPVLTETVRYWGGVDSVYFVL